MDSNTFIFCSLQSAPNLFVWPLIYTHINFRYWCWSWYHWISILVRRSKIPHVDHTAQCIAMTLKSCTIDSDTDGNQYKYNWKVTNTATPSQSCEGTQFSWTDGCREFAEPLWSIDELHTWYSDENCNNWMSHAEKEYLYSFWFWLYISVSFGGLIIICFMYCYRDKCMDKWRKFKERRSSRIEFRMVRRTDDDTNNTNNIEMCGTVGTEKIRK